MYIPAGGSRCRRPTGVYTAGSRHSSRETQHGETAAQVEAEGISRRLAKYSFDFLLALAKFSPLHITSILIFQNPNV